MAAARRVVRSWIEVSEIRSWLGRARDLADEEAEWAGARGRRTRKGM